MDALADLWATAIAAESLSHAIRGSEDRLLQDPRADGAKGPRIDALRLASLILEGVPLQALGLGHGISNVLVSNAFSL